MNDLTDSTGNEQVLRRAAFDPKLKLYNFFSYLSTFVATIIGLPLALVWVLGFGFYWTNRQFNALHCELSSKKLSVKRGVLFKVEKTIPLEQIQDMMVKEGPLLRAFGLCALKIETAGQSTAGASEADLVGIIDPRSFRDEVLAQRDALRAQKTSPAPEGGESQTLEEIRDVLRDIRDQLGTALSNRSEGDRSAD